MGEEGRRIAAPHLLSFCLFASDVSREGEDPTRGPAQICSVREVGRLAGNVRGSALVSRGIRSTGAVDGCGSETRNLRLPIDSHESETLGPVLVSEIVRHFLVGVAFSMRCLHANLT